MIDLATDGNEFMRFSLRGKISLQETIWLLLMHRIGPEILYR